jgi:hypothetical protein
MKVPSLCGTLLVTWLCSNCSLQLSILKSVTRLVATLSCDGPATSLNIVYHMVVAQFNTNHFVHPNYISKVMWVTMSWLDPEIGKS